LWEHNPHERHRIKGGRHVYPVRIGLYGGGVSLPPPPDKSARVHDSRGHDVTNITALNALQAGREMRKLH